MKAIASRPLLIAGLLACTSFGLARLYLRRLEASVSGGGRVAVLYLRDHLRTGHPVTQDALSVREIPAAYVDERDVRARDQSKVVGIDAAFDLASQQRLQWSDLAVRPDSRKVSALVAPGKRAVAVQLGPRHGNTLHLVRPGDYVDMIATLDQGRSKAAIVLLQRVLVLAVGEHTERMSAVDSRPEKKRSSRSDARVLTLSIDLAESQLIALASEQGTLSVAVRHQDDHRLQDSVEELRASSLIEAQRAVLARRKASPAPAQMGPVRLEEAE